MSQVYNDNNIKVVNEEYDRILDNPDGLIMSDALTEILGNDWPTLVGDDITDVASAVSTEKNSINIMNGDEAIATLHGRLQSFESGGTSLYNLGFTLRGNHKEFLNTLMGAQYGALHVGLEVTGQNGFVAKDLSLAGWSFSSLDPYDILLSINFGSSDVTFR